MNDHVNVVLEISNKYFEAICTCGWTSSISYFEEVDLLRAIHAHDLVAFGIGR